MSARSPWSTLIFLRRIGTSETGLGQTPPCFLHLNHQRNVEARLGSPKNLPIGIICQSRPGPAKRLDCSGCCVWLVNHSCSARIYELGGCMLPRVKSCTLHCRRATRSAFCMSGEGQSGLQKACADAPRSVPRLIRIAPQVLTGTALVEFSTVAALR